MCHNAWVVRKQSSTHKPWEECPVKDVRLVVGLDPMNKFLSDPPGKVTKTEHVFTAIANWEFLGELDLTDAYFQIKFRTDSEAERQKLGYLAIKTAMGTLVFSRAILGLLGMDVFLDEITDRVFGDLIMQGKAFKLADNIYFGGSTLEEFHQVFNTILSKMKDSDLKAKPSKLSVNIQEQEILGLNWKKRKNISQLPQAGPSS